MKRSRKKLLNLLVVGLFCTSGSPLHAALTMDDNFAAIQPPKDLYSLNEQTTSPIDDPRDALLKSEGACALGLSGYAVGHMVWNGKTYYVTTQQYQSAAQCAENRRSVRAHEKDSKILPDGGVCELFLYDEHLELLARQKVRLPDIGGGSWCNGSFALGRASKHMDAILYSLRYYRVNTPRAGSIEAIGTGWIRSTYLFQLRQDADGKPYFEQDDSCLGSPNRYATIADARKALAQCENKKRACD